MDTLEKYIRMCEKAEEIQKLKNLKEANSFDDGDFYYNPFQKKVLIYPFGFPNYRWNRLQCIWLPRQDQLQKIVNCYAGVDVIMEQFYDWCKREDEYGNTNFDLFETFEQLWLSFVMRKLYQKVWDDDAKEWVRVR